MRYNYNSAYFDVVDAEEKAYWLGFIAADGCVTLRDTGKRGGRFNLKIGLARADRDHLVRLAQCLEYDGPIHDFDAKARGKKYPASALCVNGRHFIETLVAHGIIPNKSLIGKWDRTIRCDLLRHYWRGYVDGDGSLEIRKGHNRIRLFSGSLDVAMGFVGFVRSAGIGSDVRVKTNKRGFFDVAFGGKHLAGMVAHLLYDKATISLPRKFVKATEMIDSSRFSGERVHSRRGILQHMSKLTDDDVRTMRALHRSGMRPREIHALYPNVCRKSVGAIVNNRTRLFVAEIPGTGPGGGAGMTGTSEMASTAPEAT